MLTTDWLKTTSRGIHPLHRMSALPSAYPPELPAFFIRKFTHPGDVVLDPFAGPGTTVLQSCVDGRTGIGLDPQPEAYALLSAKVKRPDMAELRNRIDDLSNDMFFDDAEGEPAEISNLFSPIILRQLVFLKKNLDPQNVTDAFLKGVLVGMLNGKLDTADLFADLRQRTERMIRRGFPKSEGRAWQCDARDIHTLPDPFLKKRKVKLFLGVPPSLKKQKPNLTRQIRQWFLDDSMPATVPPKAPPRSLKIWLAFLQAVCRHLYQIAEDKAVCVFMIPDMLPRGAVEPLLLARMAWNHLRDNKTPWILSQILDVSPVGKARARASQSVSGNVLDAAQILRTNLCEFSTPCNLPVKPLMNRLLILYKKEYEELA